MNPEVFEGACQCGEVTYRVTGHSMALFACHCADCQKQSSSAFGMALWVKQPQLTLLSGTPHEWIRHTPSGRQTRCQFCPTCGTRLFHIPVGQDDLLSIKPGTLNDTAWLQPVAHIWTVRAQPWMHLDESVLHYPGNPDGFSAMAEAWAAQVR